MGLKLLELSLLVEAKRNSDNLVSLENRAFEAVFKKDYTTAIALVYGEQYREAKASIMQLIAKCRSLLEECLVQEAASLAGRANLFINVTLAALLANVATVIKILLFFYS